MTHTYGLGGWFALILGLLVAVAATSPVAIGLSRIRGAYLGIATMNIAAIVQAGLYNWQSFTGGANGILGLPKLIHTVPLAIVVAGVAAFFWWLSRSRRGAGIRLQRDDELLALSAGVNVKGNLTVMLVASALIGGLYGEMTAYWFGFVFPDSYSFLSVLLAIAMVFLGGTGEWSGPLLGAVFFTIVPEWMRPFGVWAWVFAGGVLLLVVYFLPEGVIGYARSAAATRRAMRSEESRKRLARIRASATAATPAPESIDSFAPIE
jgi:branched-chain amino acid transport system permease protein